MVRRFGYPRRRGVSEALKGGRWGALRDGTANAGNSSEKPDRLGFFVERVKHSALATFGLM
jgi:hypothetical protein